MRKILSAVIVVAVLVVGVTLMRTPLLDRDWDNDVRILAGVHVPEDESRFRISQVRDWTYTASGPATLDRFDATYNADDLVGMSFYEQELDASGLIAHTFVVFEFTGDYEHPRLGISVETRREQGETYSLIKGALRGFELMHTWASEADLVERRVRFLGYRLTRYTVRQPLADQRRYLFRFLRETMALAREPRWYNTITSNCTNVIIGAANEIEPGFLPFDKSFVLTGLAAEYLIERGVLESTGAVSIGPDNIDDYMATLRNREPRH
jgi:hypothetical protein